MISKNGAGIVVAILSLTGLEVGEGEVVEVLSALGTVISFILLIWNQIDRPDTKWFFFKK